MCGIAFSIHHSHSTNTSFDHLETFLARRGPDSQMHLERTFDTFKLVFYSTVLHIRGEVCAVQPLISDDGRWVLQWNGEIYSPLGDSDESLSDTDYMIKKLSSDNYPLKFLALINAEFAFVLFDSLNGYIYYGRDRLGRRSLLQAAPSKEQLEPAGDANQSLLCLSSVSNYTFNKKLWHEVPATGIFKFNIGLSTFEHHAWDQLGHTNTYRISRSILLPSELEILNHHPTITQFDEAFRRKLVGVENSNASLAILFSGGIDSVILALFAHRNLPPNIAIDLLNVAFYNERFVKSLSVELKNTSKHYEDVPDRISGRHAHQELAKIYPHRRWNFVRINVSRQEYDEHKLHVGNLLYPSNTIMDLSIGIAIWFASRGVGFISQPALENNVLSPKIPDFTSSVLQSCTADDDNLAPQVVPFKSLAKIVLVGMGADEQFGGYTKHRAAFKSGGHESLCKEIERQISEIPNRNLGRDDRVISDHGREARFPFLDDQLLAHIRNLPINLKCDFTKEKGSNDKIVIRKIAKFLGISDSLVSLPKRAIQFGAKTAKMEDASEHGSDELNLL